MLLPGVKGVSAAQGFDRHLRQDGPQGRLGDSSRDGGHGRRPEARLIHRERGQRGRSGSRVSGARLRLQPPCFPRLTNRHIMLLPAVAVPQTVSTTGAPFASHVHCIESFPRPVADSPDFVTSFFAGATTECYTFLPVYHRACCTGPGASKATRVFDRAASRVCSLAPFLCSSRWGPGLVSSRFHNTLLNSDKGEFPCFLKMELD